MILYELFHFIAITGAFCCLSSFLLPRFSGAAFPVPLSYGFGCLLFGISGILFLLVLPGFLMLISLAMALLIGWVTVDFVQHSKQHSNSHSEEKP